ncbi:MAG: hypothetical protein WB460_19650 [Candidatus Acidiferrales bacterium]
MNKSQGKNQEGGPMNPAPEDIVKAEPGSKHGQNTVNNQQKERGLPYSNAPWSAEWVEQFWLSVAHGDQEWMCQQKRKHQNTNETV